MYFMYMRPNFNSIVMELNYCFADVTYQGNLKFCQENVREFWVSLSEAILLGSVGSILHD